MSVQPNPERIVASDVTESVWLRFGRLTSPTLCRRLLQKRFPDIECQVADRKAEGVASAVRSLIGYWRTPPASLNAAILTRYYALLQVSIAEQVAYSDPNLDLAAVQRHTEFGHGFAGVHRESEGNFPDNYYVGCMASGHFASYAKTRGIDVTRFTLAKRPRQLEGLAETECKKLISLGNLLLRIPELRETACECLGRDALSFRVGYAEENGSPSARKSDTTTEGDGSTTTLGALRVEPSETVSASWLNSLELPFAGLEPREIKSLDKVYRYFVGKLSHPNSGLWWDHFPHYKSDYCATSVIAPFWGIADPFILHLATLYGLSIVVRYLPSLWHRVEHGELDHIRVLLENYLTIFDHIGPPLALERITGTRLLVATPGSMNAPI